MTSVTEIIRRMMDSDRPVFEPSGRPLFESSGVRTVYGDVTPDEEKEVLKYRRGYDDPIVIEANYRAFAEKLEREGYRVLEVGWDETDNRKGKQVGNTLKVYRGLSALDKLHVLGHEYVENKLMRQTNRTDEELHPTVQAMEEEMFGRHGEFPFLPAYLRTVEAGKELGLRR